MNINIIHRVSLLLATLCFSVVLSAQMVKEIVVSQAKSFTDHLSLKDDASDMDLMVKFVFNEETNTLTVNLISYRSLFVFWDQVCYKPAITTRRKLKPEMLPYIVQYEPKDRFKVSKIFKWSIPQPRKNMIFNRWITSEGMQPAPQEYKMVNDYVSQTFNIQNKRDQVSATLRDVFFMEHTDENKYEIFFGKDLYTQYIINIQRDPCFGQQENIDAALNAQDAIAKSYRTFKRSYRKGTVNNQEGLKTFQELKNLLLKQYPPQATTSSCPVIQKAWDKYNQYVDSIQQVKCVVSSQPQPEASGGAVALSPAVMSKELMAMAKLIDQSVARWLNSKDLIERRDLVKRCQSLVDDGNKMISTHGAYTKEQQKAVYIFKAAVQYYNKTCKFSL